MQKKTKKILLTILQIIISFLLLYFVFRHINIKQTFHVFKKLNYFYLSLAFVSFVVFQQLLFVLRWHTILKFNNMDFSFQKLTKYHYISIIFQIFLPAAVGADAAKAVMLFHKADKVKSVNSAIIARVMGLFVLLLLSSLGILFSHSELLVKWKSVLLATTLSIIIFFLLLFIPKIKYFISNIKWLKKIPLVNKVLMNFLENMDFKLLSSLFFSSLLIQIVSIIAVFYIFLSIGVAINFIDLVIFFPLIIFLTIVIPSVVGIGTREYFLWYFFNKAIVSKEVLAAFSVVNYGLVLIVVFIGFLFWIHSIVTNRK